MGTTITDLTPPSPPSPPSTSEVTPPDYPSVFAELIKSQARSEKMQVFTKLLHEREAVVKAMADLAKAMAAHTAGAGKAQ